MVLAVTRAELARHQAEVGFDLVGVGEALDVVDRRNEGGRRYGSDAGDGAQALDPLIVSGHALDRLVAIRELAVEGARDGEERGDQREQGPGRARARTRVRKASALPEGTR